MIHALRNYFELFPHYLAAAESAVVIILISVPIYAGLRYMLHRRHLRLSHAFHATFFGLFILFAGLAFIFAASLARKLLHPSIINIYLFVTCILAAYCFVALLDVFFVEHYLVNVRKAYISPPLRKVIDITAFIVAGLIILRYVLHFNPLTLVAIPTIAGAGIAFALQDTLKTFIAGVGLGKLIRIGEWIIFQDKSGQVVDINWARTVLKAGDGSLIYIPNSQLQTNSFTNFSAGRQPHCATLKVGVSFRTPPTRVKQILRDCALNIDGIMYSPPPAVQLLQFGDSAIQYALNFWVADYGKLDDLRDEVATRVWYSFEREGVEMPHPIRTVHLRPEAEEKAQNYDEIVAALRHWDLAEIFGEGDLKDLAESARIRIFMPGESLIKQGDQGSSVFLLLDGQLEIHAQTNDKQNIVATLKPHQACGEMSLLTGAPRTATVRAKGPVEVLEIRKEGLQKVLYRSPAAADRLAEIVTSRQAALTEHQEKERLAVAATGSAAKTLGERIRRFFNL
jgi:small-conductance mechanosensitive channel/CRP-like cAMP-binding protein